MDRMQAPPRGAISGLLADAMFGGLNYMKDPRRTQQMQGLAAMLESTGVPAVVDRISYGEPLTTGRGMTTQMRPETENTLMAALGMTPVGKPAQAGAMALGRAGERVGMAAERALEAPLQRVYDKGGLPREMLLAMGQNTVSPATVFHGTPHLFNKFDASKIGTGEGNQTYGYGLYLAENPKVAKQYKETLASKAFARIEEVGRNNYKVTAPDGTVISEGLPLGPSTRAKDAFNTKAGNLYQVDLPDEQIARMMDWDKPMNEKEMISLYESLDKVDPRFAMEFQDSWYRMNESTGKGLDGQDVYMALMNNLKTPQSVAQTLKEAGIPGIRYLDEGSRANFRVQNTVKSKPYGEPVSFMTERQAQEYAKEQAAKGFGTQTLPGTSNFVVFPGMEDMLRIEQINNQPVESLFRSLGR